VSRRAHPRCGVTRVPSGRPDLPQAPTRAAADFIPPSRAGGAGTPVRGRAPRAERRFPVTQSPRSLHSSARMCMSLSRVSPQCNPRRWDPHMLAIRNRRRKAVALATAAVLAGLTAPALTAGTATATTTTAAPHAAAYDDSYYDDAAVKTGDALTDALHTIISEQAKLAHAAVWDDLKVTDQDAGNGNNVILLYSGVSRSKSLNGGDTGDWNREHVWAQSHGGFGTSTGPGTDIHHLRPSDVRVNSVRGNKDFDNGGSAFTDSGGSLTDSDSFEPRDAVKGDVARMIFY